MAARAVNFEEDTKEQRVAAALAACSREELMFVNEQLEARVRQLERENEALSRRFKEERDHFAQERERWRVDLNVAKDEHADFRRTVTAGAYKPLALGRRESDKLLVNALNIERWKREPADDILIKRFCEKYNLMEEHDCGCALDDWQEERAEMQQRIEELERKVVKKGKAKNDTAAA